MAVLSISEFKKHLSVLSGFASGSDKAQPPADRILIQCKNGRMKLVAGQTWTMKSYDGSPIDAPGVGMTCVVDLGEYSKEQNAVIPAAPILSAAKSLRGKGTVTIDVDDNNVIFSTTTGGEIKIKSIGTSVANLVRPVKDMLGGAVVTGIGETIPMVTATTKKSYAGWKQASLDYRDGGKFRISAGDFASLTRFNLDAKHGGGELRGTVSLDFMKAIDEFVGESTVTWSDTTFAISCGPYSAFTQFLGIDPLPVMTFEEEFAPDISITVQKTDLVNAMKSMGSSAVILKPENGKLVVLSRERDRSTHIACSGSTRGYVSLDTDRATRLVQAIQSKQVVFDWESWITSPVRISGDSAWVYLARMIVS